ncbi:MAG: F0F1 ATP synthase subunit A [Alphaproteobacteria bacterium]|jgi:F-type H+-transporting ATPase subunit a|nr:F0F1 ATP synthase subunit A [Alphaproteobacteria bacterium]
MVDPLHQFRIHPLIHLELAGWDISFTNSSLFMVLATLVITTFFYFSVNPKALVPNRLQVISEAAYTFISDMIRDNTGKAGLDYFPYIFSLFLFILMGNLLGMIPYSFTFTSHIIVTFSLAVMVLFFVTIIGFSRHGFHFLRLFWPANTPVFIVPLLVPIEIMSYLTRSVSLSIRLFANMIAGHAMLKLFGSFAIALAGSVFFPVAVAALAINVAITGFEFLIALLQAYIFTILTCIYLHDALNLH